MNKREVGRVAAVAWGKGAGGVEKGRRAGVWVSGWVGERCRSGGGDWVDGGLGKGGRL